MRHFSALTQSTALFEAGPVAQNKRHRGFTLVEMLVALLLIATSSALAALGLDAIFKTMSAAQRKSSDILLLQSVFSQMEVDVCALTVALTGVDAGKTAPAMLPLSFDGQSMTLTRSTETGLQVIRWWLHKGSLRRWASPIAKTSGELLRDYYQATQLVGTEGVGLQALSDVSEWQVHFKWPAEPDWQPAQASNTRQPWKELPNGLRVQVRFSPQGRWAGSITRIWSLPPGVELIE